MNSMRVDCFEISKSRTRKLWPLALAVICVQLIFSGCSDSTSPTIPVSSLVQLLATQEAKLVALDGPPDYGFGSTVAIYENTAVIGSLGDDGQGTDSGAAYIFIRSGTTWIQQQKLTVSDGAAGDLFGHSVAISGNTTVISSRLDDDKGADSGAVYIFIRSGTTWTEQQKLTASDGADGDYLGSSVSISDDTVLVGAAGDGDDANSGSAYVFVRSGTTWTEQQKIAGPGIEGGYFGFSVSVSGDTAIVGILTGNGPAYVFVRSGTVWTEQQQLTAASGHFGVSVSVSGNIAAVGGYSDDGKVPGCGAAYVFARSGTTWTEQQKLTASDGTGEDFFGYTVAVSEDTAIVGAFLDNSLGTEAGSAYLFTRSGSVWIEQQKLTASDHAAYYNFGYSISVSGEIAVIGAHQPGAAYVYTNLFSPSPPALSSPTQGSTLSGSTTTFTWNSGVGNEAFWLYVGNSYASGNLYNSGSLSSSTLSQTVTGLPLDGRVLFVRLWYKESGTWKFLDYSYTAGGTQPIPGMTSPTTGTILQGSSVTFSWSSNGATVCNWWFYAGSSQGFKNFHDSGSIPSGTTSYLVGGLPTNGYPVWLRLWYGCSGVWKYVDAKYTASIPTIVNPALGSTLSASTETFTWADNGWGSQMWWLYVGTTQGASNFHDSGWIKNPATTSRVVNGLPTDGSPIWARLWFKKSTTGWQYKDVRYPEPTWQIMQNVPTTNQLSGVWGTSDTDIFAVGNNGTILHYDGSAWTLQTSGVAPPASITSVWGSAANNVYAVGVTNTTVSPSVPTFLHYDGSSWSFVVTGYDIHLWAIHGTSANNIWAVGDAGHVFHFDGNSWVHSSTGGNFGALFSVWSFSSMDTWVSGNYGQVYQYNGSAWVNKPVPQVTSSQYFYGIWGTDDSNMYAIGGNDQVLMKYNGSAWSVGLYPDTRYAIAGTSTSNIYVVGGGDILWYDGMTWNNQPKPSGTTAYHLGAVWIAPSGNVYAVGTNGTIVVRK